MIHHKASDLAPRRSLAIWAGIAIFLVAFSYVFTLLLAVAFVYLPYLLLSVWSSLNALVVFLAGVLVSIVILWSLLPRKDNFVAPGPSLRADRHPRLFAELTSIAEALKETVPLEVYLLPDVNAWVAERGGTMGFGSRRVMGLGLPLIRILSISQLRAVLAHEFGHYYGGDTRLWPWVHKTRSAMARTLRNLGSDSLAEALGRIQLARLMHHLAVAALLAYWKLFMRITQAISRLHEYRADELASHVAGPQALIEGLSAVHGASAALPVFWGTEMLPAIEAGYRPSFAEGFAHFIAVPAIATAIAKHVETEIQQPANDPYDTHPPLKDRIAAVRLHFTVEEKTDSTPAITLLDSVDEIELELLKNMAPERNVAGLKSMPWDRIGAEAYLPAWREVARESASLLTNYTLAQLPELVANLHHLAAQLRDPKGMLLTREQRIERAAQLLWRALTVVLCERGWYFHATPGEFYLEHEGCRISPVEIVAQIRSGACTPDDWRQRCLSLGISEIPLAPSAI
jgi:heat shock protein HtpX